MGDPCDTLKPHEKLSVLDIRFRLALRRWWRPFLSPGVFVIGLAATTYAVAQLMKTQEIPRSAAWARSEPLGILLIGSAVVSFFGILFVLHGYRRSLKKEEYQDALVEVCKGAWHLAVSEIAIASADLGKIGVHVWGVRGVKGSCWLEKLATFTLTPRRETQVIWRKGKGAIGVAWATTEPVIANVENLETLCPTEEAFCALEAHRRYGLNWREFKKSKHYRAILAIPLETRPNHVAGCLSIDLQLDGLADSLDTLSKTRQLSNLLTVAEGELR